MSDLSENLRAAFQVEHIEHLECVRALLSQEQPAGDTKQLDEVYRRVHSLKGAARVMGFSSVEQLSHRLESLFARLKADHRFLEPVGVRTVFRTLDLIEDSAACELAGRPPPDPGAAVAEIDALLNGQNVAAPTQPAALRAAPSRQARLWQAFQEEYVEYLQALRKLIAHAQNGAADQVDLGEAFRCANSLQGAARLAGAPAVEAIALRLESLFARLRSEQRPLITPCIKAVEQALAAIEQVAPLPEAGVDLPLVQAAIRGIEGLSQAESNGSALTPAASSEISALAESRPAPARPLVETVRLSTQSLDRLLQSSGHLTLENLRQERLGRELEELRQQLTALAGELKSIKRTNADHQRQTLVHERTANLGHSLDFVERELSSMARKARGVHVLQRQSAWSVKQLAEQLAENVRHARLAPAETEFQGFRKMMRDLARDEGKEIEFCMRGLDVLADRLVLQALKDPLMHLLRNSVYHGIESPELRQARGKSPAGQVSLEVQSLGNQLTLQIADDGQGIDLEKIKARAVESGLLTSDQAAARPPEELLRLIFQPGFSTAREVTDLAGRGMGLSIAYEALVHLQGNIEVAPRAGGGVLFSIAAPLSIATHRLLVVRVQNQEYAIPASGIEAVHRLPLASLQTVAGRPMVEVRGQLLRVAALANVLQSDGGDVELPTDMLPLVVIRSGNKRLALIVDELVAYRQAILKPLGPLAERVSLYSGGMVREDGAVSLVLNPAELIERTSANGAATPVRQIAPPATRVVPKVLVVDDSFTTRTLETNLLESNGYQVRVAVDGMEALARLRAERIDLVISDVQMPRLDGFGLIEAMKQDARLANIPVIVVSSIDRAEDQERGMRLGADAYIVKKKFDHQELLKVIQQIV